MTISPEIFAIGVQVLTMIFFIGQGWSRLATLERDYKILVRRLYDKEKTASETTDRLARIEEKLIHIDALITHHPAWKNKATLPPTNRR